MAASADGKRKLFIGNYHLNTIGLFIQNNLGNFRRRQRINDKGGVVRRPLDDVDLFPLKFANNGLHPGSPHADTRTDRIDAGIV